MTQRRSIPVLNIFAAVFFAGMSVFYFSTGYWMKAVSMLCMLFSFALLGLFARYQIGAMKWAAWLLLAAAVSIQVLSLVNRFAFDNQLF